MWENEKGKSSILIGLMMAHIVPFRPTKALWSKEFHEDINENNITITGMSFSLDLEKESFGNTILVDIFNDESKNILFLKSANEFIEIPDDRYYVRKPNSDWKGNFFEWIGGHNFKDAMIFNKEAAQRKIKKYSTEAYSCRTVWISKGLMMGFDHQYIQPNLE